MQSNKLGIGDYMTSPSFLYMYLIFFKGRTQGIWKFPGYGLNWNYSYWPVPQPRQCGIEPRPHGCLSGV